MPNSQIPKGFLPKTPPPDASLHILNFATTNPPIPAYEDYFAAIIDNLLTKEECTRLLHLAEASASTEPGFTPWPRAMVNMGNNQQTLLPGTRNCGRIIFDSTEIAERLMARLMPFLQQCGIQEIENWPLVTGFGPAKRGEVYRVTRLNERLRFLKYEGGEYFRPHGDGPFVTEDGMERSLFTMHLYLNGDGVQDWGDLERAINRAERMDGIVFGEGGNRDGEGDERMTLSTPQTAALEEERLLGGATSFTDGYSSNDAVRVFPKAGSVLLFQQRNLVHGGDDVFRGVKYTVRSDIMYRKEAKE